ncbi:hypothetical protein [Pseudomonas versuta]|nr:hypothetical protein [Pseudomonas versuta]
MTSVQISALIILILSTVLLYWIGYRNGLADGRSTDSTPGPRRKAA